MTRASSEGSRPTASQWEPGPPEDICISHASHVDALCASGLLVKGRAGWGWGARGHHMVLYCTLEGADGSPSTGTLGPVCYRA